MASLLEHVMINKLSSELKDAINTVGGDASSATGPMDYPQIILDQLAAKQASVGDGTSLIPGKGISIVAQGDAFVISANANAGLTEDLALPYNIDSLTDVDFIRSGTSIQETLKVICNNVLPTLPSVLSGDVIKASADGTDQYQHPKFTSTGIKSGLTPDKYYIRIFIISQQEPIYIELIGEMGDMNFVGVDTDSIDINVKDGKISADLKGLGDVVVEKENLSQELLKELIPSPLSKDEAEEIFDKIFE